MKESLILEGKIYISARRAAKIINYAQDYIGQLCRSGKLDCKMIGRSWYVTEDSLLAHREQAVDATQERVLKVVSEVKSVNTAASEKKIEITAPSAPSKIVAPTQISQNMKIVPSPFVSPFTNFKYEADNKPALPAIAKKLPQNFSLPKKVTDLTTTPFVSKYTPKKIEVKSSANVLKLDRIKKDSLRAESAAGDRVLALASPRALATTLTIVLLLVSGFMFSLTGLNMKKVSKSDTATSITANFFSGLMRSLGFGKPATIASLPKSTQIETDLAVSVGTTTQFNGIGVVPSAGTAKADALQKQKIQTTFSDEVTVSPDQSGTAGVITPVFKKGSGNDFVYVLVPVKEKKQ